MVKYMFGGGRNKSDDMDKNDEMGRDIGEKGGRTGGFDKGSDDYSGDRGEMDMPDDMGDETI